jgi:hypothetical protein
MQLPQWLAANSLHALGREGRSNGMEFFVDDREFSEPRKDTYVLSRA